MHLEMKGGGAGAEDPSTLFGVLQLLRWVPPEGLKDYERFWLLGRKECSPDCPAAYNAGNHPSGGRGRLGNSIQMRHSPENEAFSLQR